MKHILAHYYFLSSCVSRINVELILEGRLYVFVYFGNWCIIGIRKDVSLSKILHWNYFYRQNNWIGNCCKVKLQQFYFVWIKCKLDVGRAFEKTLSSRDVVIDVSTFGAETRCTSIVMEKRRSLGGCSWPHSLNYLQPLHLFILHIYISLVLISSV